MTLRAVVDKFGGKVPILHPVKDMKIDSQQLDEYLARKDFLEKDLKECLTNLKDREGLESVYE